MGIKGPKDRYGDVEIQPGIRRFVWEHAQIVRDILCDIWKSGLTISGAKCVFGSPRIDIVSMVCDVDGRRPEQKKIAKILDWPTPRTTKEARGFIGLCVYYRIFVKDFSTIALPILLLFRKNVVFLWTVDCQTAMDRLKELLTMTPILVSLDFLATAGLIVLSVDVSLTGWGTILQQVQPDGSLKPARYESGIWTGSELNYDAVKLECHGLLKALKRLRYWLFG